MSGDVLADQHPSTITMELIAGVPDALADPYPRYRALRERAPVHAMEIPGMGVLHVLSRYADCKAVLASHEFGKGDRDDREMTLFADDESLVALREEYGRRPSPMLFLNPPDHTRIRGLVSRAFTPRRIEALKPRIAAMVADVLDPMAGGGEVDLLDVLAFPLPVAVIGALVGVPPSDYEWFRQRARDGAASLELNADVEVLTRSAVALGEMGDYFDELVEVRRRAPEDDLLSALIAAEDDGDRLTHEELIANVILLFAAGFETTTNLIGNGLVALCANPVGARAAAGRPLAAALSGRGAPPLRLAGPARRPHRAGRHHPARRHADRRGRTGDDDPRCRQPRPRPASPIPSASTSAAPTTPR